METIVEAKRPHTITLTDIQKAMLRELAYQTRRSMSNMIAWLIEQEAARLNIRLPDDEVK